MKRFYYQSIWFFLNKPSNSSIKKFAINFVDFVISYLNDPLNVSLKELDELFTQFNLSKAKIFEDPKLLSFYSWMKSRLLNKNVYTILLEEYNDTKH